MADARTVVDLINVTASFFKSKGIANTARLDAELLLAQVLGCERIELYVRFDRPVEEPHLSQFRELVRERGRRRPVKQMLGRCEFMSHEFGITPDVLIPRPETETLVAQALTALDDSARTVVDLGTGSGNIAISIALARPNVAVYATDISEPALEVARRNSDRLGVAGRVTLLAGDMFAPLVGRGLDGTVDCVVSNPPYVADSELPGLMPEVAEYEPRGALVSEKDGMGHTLRIIAEAPAMLRGGGLLALETSPHTARGAKAAAEASGAYEDVRTVLDLGKAERVLTARKRA